MTAHVRDERDRDMRRHVGQRGRPGDSRRQPRQARPVQAKPGRGQPVNVSAPKAMPTEAAPRKPVRKGRMLATAGLVSSVAAIAGAGIAAWALPGSATQPTHAKAGDVQTASLTAFTQPPATSPGGVFSTLSGNQASPGPLGDGPLAAALSLAQQGGPSGPGGTAAGTGIAQNVPAGANGLVPTASLRALGPDFGLSDNQFTINYPPNPAIAECVNGCSRIFEKVPNPDPFAYPMQVTDRNSPNWILMEPSNPLADFLVPQGTTVTTKDDGELPVDPVNPTLVVSPDFVPFVDHGFRIKQVPQDENPMSQIMPGDPGSTGLSELASALGLDPQSLAPTANGGNGGDGTTVAPATTAVASDASGPSLGGIAALTLAYPGLSGVGDAGSANAFAASSSADTSGSGNTVAVSDPAVADPAVSGPGNVAVSDPAVSDPAVSDPGNVAVSDPGNTVASYDTGSYNFSNG